jgi:hypothetical protein
MTVPHALESKRQFGFLRELFFFAVPGRALQYMGVHFFLEQLVMDPKTRKLVFNCKVVFFYNKSRLIRVSFSHFFYQLLHTFPSRVFVHPSPIDSLSGLLSTISSTNCYILFPHVCSFIHRPSTPYPGSYQLLHNKFTNNCVMHTSTMTALGGD